MRIVVRPEDEKWIFRAIQSGAYRTADEVVGKAIEVLRSEDDWLNQVKDEINSKLDRAFDQFDRGECFRLMGQGPTCNAGKPSGRGTGTESAFLRNSEGSTGTSQKKI